MRTLVAILAGACLLATLPAGAKDDMTLALKAEVFEHDLVTRFAWDGQARCKLRNPDGEVNHISFNMPDNAYMTGIYLGTLSMKYSITRDGAVRRQASQALEALSLLCNVSGRPGLLARAALPLDEPWHDDGIWRVSDDGAYRWRGDVSSDQMTGVMYGLGLAFDLASNDAEKAVIARDAGALVDHILENERRIIGYDGEPTQWGRYDLDYVRARENMNALLLLQHVKVAHHVTGSARFADAYQQLLEEGYGEIALAARLLRDPRRINHSDDVLLFLAYYPLLRYETDPGIREVYLSSLRRFWEGGDEYPGTKPENNPIYAYLARRFLHDDSGLEGAREFLRLLPLDGKWRPETIAAYAEQFGFTFTPGPVSPPPEEGGVVPIDRRPMAWSYLVANPYIAGDRTPDGWEYNGHDYLAGYWLGRYHGYLAPDE